MTGGEGPGAQHAGRQAAAGGVTKLVQLLPIVRAASRSQRPPLRVCESTQSPGTDLVEARGKEVEGGEDGAVGAQAVLLHHVLVVDLEAEGSGEKLAVRHTGAPRSRLHSTARPPLGARRRTVSRMSMLGE